MMIRMTLLNCKHNSKQLQSKVRNQKFNEPLSFFLNYFPDNSIDATSENLAQAVGGPALNAVSGGKPAQTKEQKQGAAKPQDGAGGK